MSVNVRNLVSRMPADDPEEWEYIVELSDPVGEFSGVCVVDLYEEDHRGDVEPFVDQDGRLRCTLGAEATWDGDEISRRLEIVGVFKPCDAFNGKFEFAKRVSMEDFVKAVCDAAKFDDLDDEHIDELKKNYGVG